MQSIWYQVKNEEINQTMKKEKTLEACVETLEQATLAEKCGAHRIELCGDLSVGGITPEKELFQQVQSAIQIPIMVMIRPRGGDFCYNRQEIEQMKREIKYFKKAGTAGVVFGFLDKTQQIDLAVTEEMTQLAAPMLVTFHKAIDATPDPVAAIRRLNQIKGIQRVLTSGGQATAKEGAATLKKMQAASENIQVLAAGKITQHNLDELAALIGVHEYHGKRIVY